MSQIIDSKPKIFAVSSDNQLLRNIEEYVEDYNYEYVGSAFRENIIFEKIEKASPDLILLDSDENLNLITLTNDLELYNIPIIIIVLLSIIYPFIILASDVLFFWGRYF